MRQIVTDWRQVSRGQSRLAREGDQNDFGEILSEFASFLERGSPQHAVRFITRTMIELHGGHHAFRRFWNPLIRYIYTSTNPEVRRFWAPLLRQTIVSASMPPQGALETISSYLREDQRRRALGQESVSSEAPSSSISPLEFNPIRLLDLGVSVDELGHIIRSVAHDVPELSAAIVASLRRAQRERTEDIPVAQLIQDLNRDRGDENLRQEVASQFGIGFSRNEWRRINRSAFITGNMRALRNISNSGEYSDVSRVFTLVDPLFVSEDIRSMQANRPYRRFNENFVQGGRAYQQPAWENHVNNWNTLARRIWLRENLNEVEDTHQFRYLGLLHFSNSIGEARASLLLNNVDGTQNQSLMGTNELFPEWNRGQFTTHFTREQFDAFQGTRNRSEIERFFNIRETPSGFDLTFRTGEQLAATFPQLAEFRALQSHFGGRVMTDSQAIPWLVIREVYKYMDPVERAAAILHYCAKLHPFENGNGRLSRLWASMELVQAGHPVPVGLPTNDFLMTEEHLRLEVRRAVRLGSFWQDMLQQAVRQGVPTDDFFQRRFRGSPFEGLMHIDPARTEDLRRYVEWLERQASTPEFGRDFMRQVEQEIAAIRQRSGSLAQISEVQRQEAIDRVWREFQGTHSADLGNSGFPLASVGSVNDLCGASFLQSKLSQLRGS